MIVKTKILKSFKKKLTRALVDVFRRVIFFIPLLLSLSVGNAQTSVVVFSENFDDATSTEPWDPYFSSGWYSSSPLNVLEYESGRGQVLTVNFPAGTVGASSGLGNYRIPLDSAYKELYLSWEYFVPSIFNYGWGDGTGGGKFFGGFAGGSMTAIPNDDATDLDGWASIVMWQNGTYSTYNYFKGTTFSPDGWPYGSIIAPIEKGKWHRLTIRLKMNDGDLANGLFEIFDNNVLVYQLKNAKIVNGSHPEYFIEHIYLNSFFGGNGPEYESPIDQYMKFDNLVAFYYPPGSTGYRSGASETGRTLVVPQATSYHPLPPNKFTPAKYTDASGVIESHCAFYQPVEHTDDFETSTIEVAGASYLDINVSKFDYDLGVNFSGYKQILNIYQGVGPNKVLMQTYERGVRTIPGTTTIYGSSATIEWQAGQGTHGGFSLNYTSDGTGSGNNFSCNSYFAVQMGSNGTTVVNPPPPPEVIPPATPTNLQVTSTTTSSVTLKWNDNSTNETFFEMERMGPTEELRKTTRIEANTNTFTDNQLSSNSYYTYWIRAYNPSGGFSRYSQSIQAQTKAVIVPLNAPTGLKSNTYTESSISLEWSDNSVNENGFVITRTLALDPDSIVNIIVDANATNFTDDSLASNTTYIYTVRAINHTGSSAQSNTNIASTLSVTETKRIKDGLIAYYNFGYDPNYIVHDLSEFGTPLNLKIQQPSAVTWNDNNRLEILSSTVISSTSAATKIISEIKRTGAITLECWIKPSEPDISSTSRIVSLSLNDAEVGIVLDQKYSSLTNEKLLSYTLRVQTESTNKSGFPEIVPENDIEYLNVQHVIYIRDTLGKESLYLNGLKQAEGFRPDNFGTWNNNFYLKLGNESDLIRPWNGTFYSLAIYNKALSVSEIQKNYALGPCDNILNDGQTFTVSTYPNPSSGIVNVEIAPNDPQDFIPHTYFRILDMYGKVYYQETIFNPADYFKTTLDLNNYPGSIYFLQVISGEAQKTSKLVIQ
jgi:hypothetical protein